MTIISSLEALKKAIEFERSGADYYRKAAGNTKSEAAKSIFLFLVDEEEKHQRYLETLRQNLKAQDKWPSGISVDLARDFKMIFKEAAENIDRNIKVNTDEVEALNFARDLEIKGMNMYRELSGKAVFPEEKELYESLAVWENGHADFIQNYLDYFQDNGMFTEE